MSCFREVEKIYQAAAARERLELDLFEGGHRWGGNKSVEFFRRWIGNAATLEVRSRDQAARALTLSRTIFREARHGGAADGEASLPFAVGGGGDAEASKAEPSSGHQDP